MAFQGTYDPKKLLISFGPVLFSGLADGVFVTAVRNNQGSNLAVGSTGDAGRAISNDKSGLVTITLLQTSNVNGLLSAIEKADQESGDGVFPLFIKDLRGFDLVKASTAWIQKVADFNRGRVVADGNIAWPFETDDLDIVQGGLL